MFSAADIIEALTQRRRLKSIRPETPGQLPPGWRSWLENMTTSPRAVRGALPQDVIAELAQREPVQPPPRSASLNRWQAFATLLRQEWHAPIREERGIRVFAAGFSGVLHIFLIMLLWWLAYIDVPPPMSAEQGQNVVQAEFIGVGTPKDTGGGAPQGPKTEPQATPAPAAAPQAAQQTPREAPAQPAPPQAAPQETQPQPQPPAEPPPVAEQAQPEPTPPVEVPPAPQPLQVTEVPQPDTTFVLPPPRPQEVQLPERQITVPEVRAPTERISRVQRPTQERIAVQQIATQPVQVAPLRAEEAARLSQVQALQPTQVPTREVSVPAIHAQVREIPMPSRGTTPNAQPGTSTAPSQSAAPGTATAASTTSGGPPAPGTGVTPGAQPGAGTTPNAPPGALPSPTRGDDWGVGTRNRPGGKPGASPGAGPGIFNANGTPNLGEPPNPGQNAPGTVEAHIADLDRAGQWLKRPPYEYEPTTFDKYWRPRETLLQEWVRKGIKAIRIPIPGTSKSISCTISILQFGGACGLTDPNKANQAASARPPPAVPFKPWLQEDNGSVHSPPPAPASTSARPPGE